jgi:hypothetical protein
MVQAVAQIFLMVHHQGIQAVHLYLLQNNSSDKRHKNKSKSVEKILNLDSKEKEIAINPIAVL